VEAGAGDARAELRQAVMGEGQVGEAGVLEQRVALLKELVEFHGVVFPAGPEDHGLPAWLSCAQRVGLSVGGMGSVSSGHVVVDGWAWLHGWIVTDLGECRRGHASGPAGELLTLS